MPLDPDRVQSVFIAAIQFDGAAERSAVLDRECAANPDLRRRVEALLWAHDEPDELLDRPFIGRFDRKRARLDGPVADPQRLYENGSSAETSESAVRRTVATGSPAYSDSNGLLDHSSEANIQALPVIPGYEILEELGRGGMGVVYKGRQILLDRPCALKMILGGNATRPEVAAQFLAEAQAIARLRHPRIVQIHHVGEAQGLPFFELEYVEGGSLDGILDGTPWAPRRAAELILLVAGAVAEAHLQGIVHRDLKPANVLLMADGTPKIADFGLAVSLGRGSGLTTPELIMGSPSYMAPEQVAARVEMLGPAVDVHAIGATLYELLTGRPPFRGATISETLDQVENVEPVSPSLLVPGLPSDIETIALKCLRKDPGQRYGSAAVLAEDLQRFLGGEPILARPLPPWERAWRWSRRHPAPAVLMFVAGLGLVGSLWQWGEAIKARDIASKRAVSEAVARREAVTTLIDLYTTTGISDGDRGEHARAALWFSNAAIRADADPERRLANVVRARTWSRNAPSPLRAVVSEGSRPERLAFHPGGRHLIASRNVEGGLGISSNTLWNLDSEESATFPGGLATAPAATWNPDGTLLAVGLEAGDVVVAHFPEDDRPTRVRFAHPIRHLQFSEDGHYLAIAGGKSARVWDLRTREFATLELIHPGQVTALAIEPQGRYLATGCQDQLARLFAISNTSAIPIRGPVPHLGPGEGIGYYPKFTSPPLFVDAGRMLVTYGQGVITWRAVETGVEVRRLAFPDLSGGVAAMVLGPGGKYLAVYGLQSPNVRLLDAITGDAVGRVIEHKITVFGASFSPDGGRLLTGSSDGVARLWSVPSGEPLGHPLDLHRAVAAVAFAPGGRRMVTQDGALIRLWALPEEGVPMVHLPLDGSSSHVAISPDGTLAIPTGMSYLTGGPPRNLRPRWTATGLPAGPEIRAAGPIVDASFSPDGRSIVALALGGGPGKQGDEVAVWDRSTGRARWRAALPSDPRSVAYRGDGHRLAVLCGGGEILIFDPEDGREVSLWRGHDSGSAQNWINNGKVAFTPDGRSLLSWGMGKEARVWEPETGRPHFPAFLLRDKCHDVEFSPDGRSLVLASYDGSVRIRDLATGAMVADLPAHPDRVYSAEFSPDGRLVATACRDRTVRIWDWRAGRLVCPPFEHSMETLVARFTPDGRWVLSASYDGVVRAWDWRTGKPIMPPVRTGGFPMSLVITPDGKHAVVGGIFTSPAVLDLGVLAAIEPNLDELRFRAELAAGQWLHEGGGVVNMAAEEWLGRWRSQPRSGQPALGKGSPPGLAKP